LDDNYIQSDACSWRNPFLDSIVESLKEHLNAGQMHIDKDCVIGLMELVVGYVLSISQPKEFCKLLFKMNYGAFKIQMENLLVSLVCDQAVCVLCSVEVCVDIHLQKGFFKVLELSRLWQSFLSLQRYCSFEDCFADRLVATESCYICRQP
jgi:hypothetical protein